MRIILALLFLIACTPIQVIEEPKIGEINFYNVKTYLNNDGRIAIEYYVDMTPPSRQLWVRYYYEYNGEWLRLMDEEDNIIEDIHSLNKYSPKNSIGIQYGLLTPLPGRYKLEFYVDGRWRATEKIKLNLP